MMLWQWREKSMACRQEVGREMVSVGGGVMFPVLVIGS